LVKGKNWSEFNINNKTSKRAMLNPQEKTTLEIQPSINSKNETGNRNEYSNMETNCNTETKMNLQTETENEIAIGNEMQKWIGNQRQKTNWN